MSFLRERIEIAFHCLGSDFQPTRSRWPFQKERKLCEEQNPDLSLSLPWLWS